MILVTGASGHLGREIASQLAQKKLNFRCLVRKTSKVKELEEVGAPLYYGDVTDRKSLKEAMEGVKQVISTHSLGLPKQGLTCWDVDYQSNLNLIELLKENGGDKFVYISALGASLSSPYQMFKVKKLIEDALAISGVDYTIFRPSGFFSDFTMAAKIVQKYHIYPVMGWGEDLIQGIHMADIAFCAIDSLKNSKASHRLFLIGGPETLTLKQVAGMYAKILGHRVRSIPVPVGFQKSVGYIVDILTGYRYEVHGFVDAFSGNSTCDNGPLLETFDVKLQTFEHYLRDFFAQKSHH